MSSGFKLPRSDLASPFIVLCSWTNKLCGAAYPLAKWNINAAVSSRASCEDKHNIGLGTTPGRQEALSKRQGVFPHAPIQGPYPHQRCCRVYGKSACDKGSDVPQGQVSSMSADLVRTLLFIPSSQVTLAGSTCHSVSFLSCEVGAQRDLRRFGKVYGNICRNICLGNICRIYLAQILAQNERQDRVKPGGQRVQHTIYQGAMAQSMPAIPIILIITLLLTSDLPAHSA